MISALRELDSYGYIFYLAVFNQETVFKIIGFNGKRSTIDLNIILFIQIVELMYHHKIC